jgi:hypothetical protein
MWRWAIGIGATLLVAALFVLLAWMFDPNSSFNRK